MPAQTTPAPSTWSPVSKVKTKPQPPSGDGGETDISILGSETPQQDADAWTDSSPPASSTPNPSPPYPSTPHLEAEDSLWSSGAELVLPPNITKDEALVLLKNDNTRLRDRMWILEGRLAETKERLVGTMKPDCGTCFPPYVKDMSTLFQIWDSHQPQWENWEPGWEYRSPCVSSDEGVSITAASDATAIARESTKVDKQNSGAGSGDGNRPENAMAKPGLFDSVTAEELVQILGCAGGQVRR